MKRSQGEVYQLVSFEIAEEEFGIDILKVQEIIRFMEMTRMPNTPDFLEGVINLRGQIVPVVDLRKRFNLPGKEKDKDSRIVVVELSNKTVGFLVDSVQEVIRVETSVIDPPPELVTTIHTHYITGVAKLEDRLLILLDLDAVLSKNEQKELQVEPVSA
ncbi:MAG: chemotaxis protein CheW [Rhodothermales bacterium]